MFTFLKKMMIAGAVKSYMKRFLLIDNLHKSGRLSEEEYRSRKQQAISEYHDYINSTPEHLLPTYAKR